MEQPTLSPSVSLSLLLFIPLCQVQTSDLHLSAPQPNTLTVLLAPLIPLHLLWPWNTLPWRLFTEGMDERERDAPCCSYMFSSFSVFEFDPNCVSIHQSTRHSFSWLFVPIQCKTGHLPRHCRMINTALAGVTQCCAQWGVRLCHLILLVMPRLKRDRNKKKER